MANFCSKCGAAIIKDARFCSKCGNSLIEKPYQNQSVTEITNSSQAMDIINKASSLYQKGDFSEAIVLYDKLLNALIYHPGLVNQFEVRKARAIVYCAVGRFTEAEQELRQLLDVLESRVGPCPSSPVMYWYLVACNKGDKKRAMDDFLRL